MSECGYKAKHPIVLIPGFCSSGLYVEEGNESWKGQRVWLSLAKLTSESSKIPKIPSLDKISTDKIKMEHRHEHRRSRSSSDPNERSSESDTNSEDRPLPLTEPTLVIEKFAENQREETVYTNEYKNRWLNHMCLAKDGYSDPVGIKVRPVSGVAGVSYLTPGKFTNSLSYVILFLEKKILALNFLVNSGLWATHRTAS